MTVEELRAKLQSNSYTPKTEQQMQEEAQARYKGTYDQQRLNAQQGYDATAQALRNQLATLGTAYDRQAQEAQKATDAAISAADRRSLSRGMQRSSYNAATLANLQEAGNRTLTDIQADRTAAEAGIAEQEALASRQLQEQLAQLDSSYAADVQAAIDALKEQDYTRQQEADQYNNNLLLQLYEMEEAAKANDLARKLQEEQLRAARLENQLAEAAANNLGSAGGGSGGSAGGGGSNDAAVPNQTNVPVANDTAAMDFLGNLGGYTLATPGADLIAKLNTALKNTAASVPAKKKANTSTSAKIATSGLDTRRDKKQEALRAV